MNSRSVIFSLIIILIIVPVLGVLNVLDGKRG